MTTKIRKWGNSLAFRLPKEIVEKFGLFDGSTIKINTRNRNIVLRPTAVAKRSISDLVAEITESNKHEVVDWGGKRGVELW